MKLTSTILVIVAVVFCSPNVGAKANNFNEFEPVFVEADTRIETIGDHAFFVFSLASEKVNISYGDRVDLYFGYNNVITVYNISDKENQAFSNTEDLVAFIAPEDLRCFKNKKLRKIKIYAGNDSVVIKTNIEADYIKIK